MFRRRNEEANQSEGGNYVDIEEADFEMAIDETGFGMFNYYVYLSLIPVTWSFMFNTSAMSFIIPAIDCEFNLTSLQQGVLNGAIYAGMIPSGLVVGSVADVLGRQRCLFWALLLDTLSGLISTFAVNFEMMVVSKFLGGIAMCAAYSTAYTILVEFVALPQRDTGVLVMGCFTSCANFLQPFLAYLLIPMKDLNLFSILSLPSWRLFLFMSSMPSFLGAVLIFFVPESPKFLMHQGRMGEALDVFRGMYARNFHRPKDSYPVRGLVTSLRPNVSVMEMEQSILKGLQKGYQKMKLFFYPPFVKVAAVIFILQALSLMSNNVMRFQQPQVLKVFFAHTEEKSVGLCQLMNQPIPNRVLDNKNFRKTSEMFAGFEHSNNAKPLDQKIPNRGWTSNDVRSNEITTEMGLPFSSVAINRITRQSSDNITTTSTSPSTEKPTPKILTVRTNDTTDDTHGNHNECDNSELLDMRIYSVVSLMGVFSFLYYIATVFLLKGMGKKLLYICAMIICGVCSAVYPWSFSLYVVLLAGIYLALIFTTNNLVLGCSVSHFPTSLRASAVSLTMMFGRLGSLIGNLIFPDFIENYCSAAFFTLAAISFGCALLCAVYLSEEAEEMTSQAASELHLEDEEDFDPMKHSMYMIST